MLSIVLVLVVPTSLAKGSGGRLSRSFVGQAVLVLRRPFLWSAPRLRGRLSPGNDIELRLLRTSCSLVGRGSRTAQSTNSVRSELVYESCGNDSRLAEPLVCGMARSKRWHIRGHGSARFPAQEQV